MTPSVAAPGDTNVSGATGRTDFTIASAALQYVARPKTNCASSGSYQHQYEVRSKVVLAARTATITSTTDYNCH